VSRPPFAAALALAALLGCTDLGTKDRFHHPVPAPFTLAGGDPAPDQTGVPVDQTVDVLVSDLPDPDSVDRESYSITSGPLLFTGGYHVDLIDRRISFIPARAFPPHLGMRVHVTQKLRSLDGRTLAAPADYGFMTGESAGGAPPPVPAVTAVDLEPLFDGRCAGACHAGPGAILGVDLGSAQAARATLVAQPSIERPAIQRVAAGDHARSYLVRKLLGASTVVGDRMPPDAPLDAAELRRIADWIDGGAQ
jgi:hypothetical protein